MSRRSEREQAMQVIFQSFFNKSDPLEEVIESYFAGVGEELRSGPFFLSLVNGVREKEAELLSIIERFSVGWKTKRISKVMLAILEIALYEILYIDDVPESVSVNEAVELAKDYDSQDAAAFINGILGSFLRSDEMKSKDDSNATVSRD